MNTPTPPRPQHPELAALYDDALQHRRTIVSATDRQLVVWEETDKGSLAALVVIIIGFCLAVVPGLILLWAYSTNRTGDMTVYTVAPSGQIMKRVEANVNDKVASTVAVRVAQKAERKARRK